MSDSRLAFMGTVASGWVGYLECDDSYLGLLVDKVSPQRVEMALSQAPFRWVGAALGGKKMFGDPVAKAE